MRNKLAHPAVAAVAVMAVVVLAGTVHAADFAPAGAKATLSVEYRFVSKGSDAPSKDGVFKVREWDVLRSAEVVAVLEATKPQPMPAMHPVDAQQQAKQRKQQKQVAQSAAQMAPMMAGAQAIVAKCGEDEKCIERETMKIGAGLAGTQQLDDTLKSGRETAAVLKPGADRYQRWQGKSQTGRFEITERWHVVHKDPICMSLPRGQCTHDLERKGGGEFAPSGSAAMMEIDTQGSTMMLALPGPIGLLAYTETQSTDEPSGTHDTPTAKGPVKSQMPLRLAGDNKSVGGPIKLALKGGWRSQSGQQVVNLGAGGWHSVSGEPGKLVVTWRFVAQ